MIDDDEETPQVRPAPLHLADPFGPGRDPTDPIVYMSRAPSPRAQQIMAAVMREAGDAAPMQMVATLAERGELAEQHLCDMAAAIQGLSDSISPARIERIERMQRASEQDRKRTRGYLWKAAVAAAGLLAPSFAWFLHTREAAAAANQQMIDLQKTIDDLKIDLREVRSVMHRLGMDDRVPTSSGVDDPVISPMPPTPDKFSLLHWDGDAGNVWEQVPKLQNLQVATRLEHSMFELQIRPHDESGLGFGADGAVGAGNAIGDWHAASTTLTTTTMVRMARVVPHKLLQWLPAQLGPEGSEHVLVSHP